MSPTAAAADLLAAAQRVFVLTGAGISTESGIPDFRGPDGMWTRNPAAQRMFDLAAYRADRDLRIAAWQVRRASEIRTARPNEGHRALASWQHHRSVHLATQNIDGLHQRAGSDGVHELHGTFWQAVCLTCDSRQPIQDVFARIDRGEPDPDCVACGGILRTATVAFGQRLPADVLDRAVAAAHSCDLAFAIGSSLAVQPAASLCDVALAAGAPLVVINGEPTGYDDAATVTIRDRIGPTLTALTGQMA